jgi:hypothetical protein
MHSHVKVHPQGDQEYSVHFQEQLDGEGAFTAASSGLDALTCSLLNKAYTHLDDNQNYIVRECVVDKSTQEVMLPM